VPVEFFSEHISPPSFNSGIIGKWVETIIDKEDYTPGVINIIFCNDNYLLELNNRYLNRDHYTDVLSFDNSENQCINADIYISLERVEENSKKYSVPFADELNRVIIHGVLHLVNYNDSTEEEKKNMTEMENKYLEFLRSMTT